MKRMGVLLILVLVLGGCAGENIWIGGSQIVGVTPAGAFGVFRTLGECQAEGLRQRDAVPKTTGPYHVTIACVPGTSYPQRAVVVGTTAVKP